MDENNCHSSSISALDKAANILRTADEDVVMSMMDLLNNTSQETDNWGGQHTSSALKILSSHVASLHETKLLEIESDERSAKAKQTPYIAAVGFMGTLALSWLFLEFDKPEYIIAILSGIFGFAGGYGVSNVKKIKG